jgi:hypothetical protein
MTLAVISLAPYPSLTEDVGRAINRPDLTNTIKRLKNERFTMRDIGALRDRIDRLEYLTALTLLEKNSKDLLIPDENGLDRFKNGILVDGFVGHNIGNVFDLNYKISIDKVKGEMRPLFALDQVQLNYSGDSTNVVRTNVTPSGVSRDQIISISGHPSPAFIDGETVTAGAFTAKLRTAVNKSTVSGGTIILTTKLYIENATGNFTPGVSVTGSVASATIVSVQQIESGDLVTLPYSHKILVQQPYATTTRNCAGAYYNWKGSVILEPDNDYWFDTTKKPNIVVNVENTQDNWNYLNGPWQTE